MRPSQPKRSLPRVTLLNLLCTIPLCTIPLGNTWAADPADLFQLSLEDLMAVEVTTPSKLPQSLAQAPGVVTVWSRDEIALFGGRDLGEVLARLPGVQPFSTATIWQPLTIRSDAASVNNNHVLILLNGIPLNREGYLGGIFNHVMLTSIPLDAIEHIEVVRGPGSVLYGTSAFAGVINILTKDASVAGNQVRASYGRFDTVKSEVTLSQFGADWQVSGFFQYYDTEGWRQRTVTTAGTSFDMDQGIHAPAGLVTAQYKNLRANAYWGYSQYDQLRGTVATPFIGETQTDKRYLNLGYDTELARHWQLKADVSHSYARPEIQVNPVTRFLYELDDSHFELQLHGQITPDLQLVSGLSHDRFTGRTLPVIVPEWAYGISAGYSELQYQWQQTRLIGGVQLNKADHVKLNVVPRLGVIQQLTDQFGIKVLYGQAFRAPTVGETSIKAPVPLGALPLLGNPSLEHELVTSYDLQLFYNTPGLQSALTFFRNEQKDLIVRTVTPTSITFINQGELNIKGVEAEGKLILDQHWYLTGSATWQKNEDQKGVEDVSLQPRVVVKTGLGYKVYDWSAGLFNGYYSRYQDNVTVVPTRLVRNPVAESRNILSFNLNYRIPGLEDAQAELFLDNLLNEDIYLPMVPGTGILVNTTPYRNGRYAQMGLSYRF